MAQYRFPLLAPSASIARSRYGTVHYTYTVRESHLESAPGVETKLGNTFDKDANAILDYTVDWELWLGSDTISTSSWSADSGITVVTSTNSTTSATVWLSGGTAGEVYNITNRIVTAGGRTDDRTVVVRVVNK